MPLFLLIALRSINHSDGIAIAGGVLTLLGCAGTATFLWAARRKAAGDYQLLEVENRDSDVAAYAATYLLPFLTVFSGAWQDVASLAAFIAIIGVVYVRSRLIYVNPVLALLGFRLWRVIPLTAGAQPDAANTTVATVSPDGYRPHSQGPDHFGTPRHRRSPPPSSRTGR